MQVAPMLARGANCFEIAKALNLSVPMAIRDMRDVRASWADTMAEDLSAVRAEGIARYEALYRDCLEGHAAAKREGRSTEKFLLAAAKILSQQHKLMGVCLDVNLVQQTNVIHGEVSPDAVMGAFAPMSADDYSSFIEQRGALTALPPVPEAPFIGETDAETVLIEATPTPTAEAPKPRAKSRAIKTSPIGRQ